MQTDGLISRIQKIETPPNRSAFLWGPRETGNRFVEKPCRRGSKKVGNRFSESIEIWTY